MPSANTSAALKLPQWASTDNPVMADFNAAFAKIDAYFQSLIGKVTFSPDGHVDAGWYALQGQTISGASTACPLLLARAQAYGPMASSAAAKTAAQYWYDSSADTLTLPGYGTRALAGYLPGDVNFGAVGKVTGEAVHTLTIAEMPAHTHPPASNSSFFGTRSGSYGLVAGGASYAGNDTTTGSTGRGTAHNNIQPTIVGVWMVYAGNA